MPDLETAIRLIVIGQDLLIALILMLGRGRRDVRYAAATLLLGVVAYLYMSSRVLGAFDSPFISLAVLMIYSKRDGAFASSSLSLWHLKSWRSSSPSWRWGRPSRLAGSSCSMSL